jgi:UDP-glucose 6-dehydrogenase
MKITPIGTGYVELVAETCLTELGDPLKDKVIVDKNVVPIRTSQRVNEAILKHFSVDFDVVSNSGFIEAYFCKLDVKSAKRIHEYLVEVES